MVTTEWGGDVNNGRVGERMAVGGGWGQIHTYLFREEMGVP